MPQPIVTKAKNKAKYGVIAIGSSDCAVKEACAKLAKDGVDLDYMRIRAFPFPQSVEDFIMDHEAVFVIEQNRDAQLMNLLLTETSVPRESLVSITYYAGQPLGFRFVRQALLDEIATLSKRRKSA